MIYARKKEKPVNVSVVPYEIEEFIYGRIDYVDGLPIWRGWKIHFECQQGW